MWFQLRAFLFYTIKSLLSIFGMAGHNGIPITNCLKKKTDPQLKAQFNKYKQELLKDTALIEVTDFGAGSRIFKTRLRAVSKIARVAGISNRKSKILMQVCQCFSPRNILEIGTSLGLGTYALHLGAPTARITTLEGCENTARVANRQLKKFKVPATLIIGPFEQRLKQVLERDTFELIYFDGNHSKEATITYFEWAVQNAGKTSVFVFDDIHWSKPMEAAWKKIQSHPKVQAVYTTYQWGILLL